MLRGEKNHSSHTCLWQKPDQTSHVHLGDVISERSRMWWQHPALANDVIRLRWSRTMTSTMITDQQQEEKEEVEEGARQAGIDVALFRCRASFFQFAVSSTSFAFSDSRLRTFTTNEERRSSIRDTGRTHDSDLLNGSGLTSRDYAVRDTARSDLESSKMIRRNNNIAYQSIVIGRRLNAERAIDFLSSIPYSIPYIRDTTR